MFLFFLTSDTFKLVPTLANQMWRITITSSTAMKWSFHIQCSIKWLFLHYVSLHCMY